MWTFFVVVCDVSLRFEESLGCMYSLVDGVLMGYGRVVVET